MWLGKGRPPEQPLELGSEDTLGGRRSGEKWFRQTDTQSGRCPVTREQQLVYYD